MNAVFSNRSQKVVNPYVVMKIVRSAFKFARDYWLNVGVSKLFIEEIRIMS